MLSGRRKLRLHLEAACRGPESAVIPDRSLEMILSRLVAPYPIFQVEGQQLAMDFRIQRVIGRRQEPSQVDDLPLGSRCLVSLDEIAQPCPVDFRVRWHGHLFRSHKHLASQPWRRQGACQVHLRLSLYRSIKFGQGLTSSCLVRTSRLHVPTGSGKGTRRRALEIGRGLVAVELFWLPRE